MVWPSGAALATMLAPIVPPAPGRFSITKVSPTCLPTCSNTTRAMMSLATPAGIGTTTVTLRVGQSWAEARAKAARAMAVARTTRRAIFIEISSKTRTELEREESHRQYCGRSSMLGSAHLPHPSRVSLGTLSCFYGPHPACQQSETDYVKGRTGQSNSAGQKYKCSTNKERTTGCTQDESHCFSLRAPSLPLASSRAHRRMRKRAKASG